MQTARIPVGRSRFGSLAGLGLILALLGVAGLQGQAPKPPKPEPDKQVPKKPRVEEEEEPAKKGSKVPLRLEDSPSRPEVLPTALREEADKATHPAAQALYRRLAVPHDELVDGQRNHWIVPLPNYLGANPLASAIGVARIDEKGQVIEEKNYPAGQRVVSYEQLALDQVGAFKAAVEKKGPVLSRLELAQHAEKVFAAVLRFHEGALEQRLRRGGGWADLEAKLRRALLDARLDQFQALADSGKWPAVSAFANELVRQYPLQSEIRLAITQREANHARELLQAGKPDGYVQARQSLERLTRLFPDPQNDQATDKAIKDLRQLLQEKAKGLAREAEKAVAKDKNLARQQLLMAESIWPQLPELRRLRQELRLDSVLYVRVRSLPTHLSPDAACNDADLVALDLLFEGLVRPVADPAVGQSYEPVLAAGNPRLMALGREFHLVHDARWYREGRGADDPSIDEPVTATDARSGLRRFQELVGQRIDDDPFILRLRLQQGYLDPLSLMTFKVLPKYASDPDFARRPVGSGPYMYLGEETRRIGQTAVPCAVFRANPTYGARAGKAGQPLIREICFYATKQNDPRRDFDSPEARPQLLLDLQTRQIEELTNAKSGVRGLQVYTLPSRRVYFLAVNHRRLELQNQELRRAIGLAIDRERILDVCFRAPVDSLKKPHRPANGPFPAGSWACDKTVPADLFDRAQARVRANQAKRSGPLELKYPTELPEVADACKRIKEQVLEHAGIELSLKPCSAPELRKAVMDDHDYQLAYWHWDPADETYWVWPLFDPNAAGPGGSNFLGRVNDPALENLFRKAMQYREFSEVQRLTRMIHRQLYDSMPLIPLWQLDTHLAVDQRLKLAPRPERIDPLQLFTHAELWKLEN
jgi:ABC-type transport system substrate-binding protein